ncbi:MAG: hypothetical protein IJU40_05125, partial [Desulfovibrionaceae bacterium]|nr:hypothetical protein [Desulfovibrionaceae bacterium]
MLRIFSFVIIIFFSFIAISKADPQDFLEFSFDLPQGWDGGEKVGFSTGDREEYMLILGKKDAE